MGMYDNIRMRRPMPDGYQTNSPYQTKSLECELTEFEVDDDGQIYIRWARGKNIENPIAINFTGGIDFYDTHDTTYFAFFDSGKLVCLRTLPKDRYQPITL